MPFFRLSHLTGARLACAAALACLMGALALPAHAADSVTVNTATTYQTMTGWEVHARAWEQDKVNNNYDPTAKTYAPVVAAKLVNELGINRLQLPVRSGWMNNTDWWTRFVNRQITYAELNGHWYEKQSGAPYQYSEFDHNVETWLLPMKQALEAKGERLYVSLIGVDFNSATSGNFEFALNATAYANFIKAYANRLKTKYGVTLDAFEITCEPENTKYWGGEEIGKAAVALDAMFKASGYPNVNLIGPSVTNAANTLPFMNEISIVPGAMAALDTISYHRYSPGDYAAIGAYAKSKGKQAAMSEWFNATIDTIFDDLTIVNASFWQKWAIAGRKGIGSNPQAFHYTADFTNPSNPTFTYAPNSAAMSLFFKYVRLGAVRVAATSATMRTVAFVNPDGNRVVVSKRNAGGGSAPVTFSGLRAGTYGVRAIGYGAANPVDLADVTVGSSGSVTVTLPEGYITLYGKGTSTSPPPPTPGALSFPGSTTFAAQTVGTTSATSTVNVTNTGGTAVTVSGITSTNPTEFIVSGSTCASVAAGATCSFKVAFKPSATGTRTGSVTVTSTGTGSPQAMAVSGSGTAVVVVPPGKLSFVGSIGMGTTPVGTTGSPLTVTVSNVGGTTVTVSSIASSNASEFIVSGSTCTTVAAGASCSFKVAFKPAAIGARAANVTVTSNGVGSPQVMAASGTGASATSPGQLSIAPLLTFSGQPVGSTSAAKTVTVTNIGSAAVAVSGIANTNPGEFTVSSSTCATVPAGGSCTFRVAFKPTATGVRAASIAVNSNGVPGRQMNATGTGTVGVSEDRLSMIATSVFVPQEVGTTSAKRTIAVQNAGTKPVTVYGVFAHSPQEFPVSDSTCGALGPGATCTFKVAFKPATTGTRAGGVTLVSSSTLSTQSMTTTGTGALPGTLGAAEGAVEMVEYHHADWDHYFMTANPDEIEKLDSGVFAGWVRTGYTIRSFAFGGERGATVCRFFSESFAPMSSHFYTPFADECAIVNGNSDWAYEGEVFNIEEAAVDGSCPADTVSVYRVYNNGRGESPNHRYTTDVAVRNAMLESGWLAEGNGADGVFMCAPK